MTKSQNSENNFEFEIISQDRTSRARAGIIKTTHGTVETPCFVPVGTKGTVKGLTPQDLKEIGVQLLFGNTYHLHLRPGEEIVEKFGGLSKFMSWNGSTITENGVIFRSHIDGSLHEFTPEISINIQKKLGADIILAFDECPPHPSTYQYTKEATGRTHAWAFRSLKHYDNMNHHSGKKPFDSAHKNFWHTGW